RLAGLPMGGVFAARLETEKAILGLVRPVPSGIRIGDSARRGELRDPPRELGIGELRGPRADGLIVARREIASRQRKIEDRFGGDDRLAARARGILLFHRARASLSSGSRPAPHGRSSRITRRLASCAVSSAR